MSDNLIKPLQWKVSPSTGNDFAFSPSHRYAIIEDGEKFVVKKTRLADRHTDRCTGFVSFESAKAFAEADHVEKLSKWLEPDPLTDTVNWFKAAKPDPTAEDITTQIGCHYEEIAEMSAAIDCDNDQAKILADVYKRAGFQLSREYLADIDRLELLDALVDQIVTAAGVAYMMGFYIVGALTEVNASNYSKFVDGKAVTDENGKIIKSENYFKPDLEPFVGGSAR